MINLVLQSVLTYNTRIVGFLNVNFIAFEVTFVYDLLGRKTCCVSKLHWYNGIISRGV